MSAAAVALTAQGELVVSTDILAAFPPIPGPEPLIRNVDAAPAYCLVDVL